MSDLIATPEYLTAAATDLAQIGTAISSANSLALGPHVERPGGGR